MKRKRKRSILLKVLLVIVAIIALQCLWLLLGPHVRAWQVERAIGRFEADPCQVRVDTLIGALETHRATAEQGNRIMSLLCHPKLNMRDAYPVGRPVSIALEPTFAFDFHQPLWEKVSVTIPDGSAIRSDRISNEPLIVETNGGYSDPGTYPVEIRCQFGVGLERGRPPTGLGYRLRALIARVLPLGRRAPSAKWKPARNYECDFTIRADVHVVAESEVTEVAARSDPELDKAMRAAIRRATTGSFPGSAILCLYYQEIPVAMSFTCSLRLADGREFPYGGWRPEQLRARAGSSGIVRVGAGEFAHLTPGEYSGTIALTPDPELARRDPAIETIWDVTLEYPITFQIEPWP